MSTFRGLATGIGSLPFTQPEPALDVIFRFTPEIPFWPQLPNRDFREGMVAQFSESIPCLSIKDKGLVFQSKGKEEELERFYSHLIDSDVEHFRISADFAAGLYAFNQRLGQQDLTAVQFLKCHITGPFTFSASINDESGIALLHEPVMFQAILKGLAMKALWQINTLKRFNKKIILFIDEPYLSCFGSAFTPINREQVTQGLKELTESIKQQDVLVGVHCCGNTDWSMLAETRTIDIISFDAFGFLDKLVLYARQIQQFLKRGGILCWGIVPTQESSVQEASEDLIARIKEGILTLAGKGVDKNLLEQQLLLSPSCGLGTLRPDSSEAIFQLLAGVSQALRR